jgi:hypothetical protein
LEAPSSAQNRLQPEYRVKRNLFEQQTFAIIEKSYGDQADGETAAELVERIKRQIIENGGRIVSADSKANFVVFEDGYEPNVWRVIPAGERDQLDRNIVHLRWIEECIKENAIMDNFSCYHLCPLPQMVPVAEF